MDAIVEAALKKWPNVPYCYGWLALDARGDWYLRDAEVQRSGPFPQTKGKRVDHDKLKAFIERNYAHDERGQWFFQNGPQRVYVQLEDTPWIWRVRFVDGAPQVHSHTDQDATVQSTWLDENGRLYLDTALGIGLVHSQDMVDAEQAVDAGLWTPQALAANELPARFGFVREPQPAAG